MRNICKHDGIKWHTTAAYHPASNGGAERGTHQCRARHAPRTCRNPFGSKISAPQHTIATGRRRRLWMDVPLRVVVWHEAGSCGLACVQCAIPRTAEREIEDPNKPRAWTVGWAKSISGARAISAQHTYAVELVLESLCGLAKLSEVFGF